MGIPATTCTISDSLCVPSLEAILTILSPDLGQLVREVGTVLSHYFLPQVKCIVR
jgi:hypothetical protein